MTLDNTKLLELVRKIDSDVYDPKVHGQGLIVGWNRNKNDWHNSDGIISKLLSSKNIDYYFIKTHSKPIQIKKLPFNWSDGTTDIELNFEGSFQLKVSNKHDAQKLLKPLLEKKGVSVEESLYQLIDEQLHYSMERIYSKYQEQRQNLLDEFYHSDTHRGESLALDSEVSNHVDHTLCGLGFKIGFTLSEAPNRIANFSHHTLLKRAPSQQPIKVDSECTLKLSNYQLYKKSGVTSLDDLINKMKSNIEQAIHVFVSGKSLFDLFCHFESHDDNGGKSISQLVRDQVEAEAKLLGYELQSFYSLPDIAPLKLLRGIRVDLKEDDASFSTGYGGGNINIILEMDVQAIEGKFDSLMHLLSNSNKPSNSDLLEYTDADLINRIKKPIITICSNVIKQVDYKTANVDFQKSLKPKIEEQIKSEMDNLYGLSVTIKTLITAETEDAGRFRALAQKPHQFKFKLMTHGTNSEESLIEFRSAFKVITPDTEHGWDAFERADFGYRVNSPARHAFNDLNPETADYNDHCKAKAIENEINDIADEVIRKLTSKLSALPDIHAWYRDAKANREFQQYLLKFVVDEVKRSRGLIIDLEAIIMDEGFYLSMAEEERERSYNHIATTQTKRFELEQDKLEKDVQRSDALQDTLTKQKKVALSDIDNLKKLDKYSEQIDHPLSGSTKVPESISKLRQPSEKETKKVSYHEAMDNLIGSDND